MATTYVTAEQRIAVVESMVDAMLEVGDIFEDQINNARIELHALSNPALRAACNDVCPEEWNRIVGTR
jgi:hypothetical protein